MANNTMEGYSAVQIGLHWTIAALVVFQLVMGGSMEEAVDAAEEGERLSASDAFLASAHYWVGLTILLLVGVRLFLRVRHGAPAVTSQTPQLQAALAKISHWAFYGLLVAMPVTGLLAFYANDEIGDLHQLGKPAFIVLITVHALAALYHQFVLRDGTLRRMFLAAR